MRKNNIKNKTKLRIAIFCANEFSIPPSERMKDIYAPLWITHHIAEELVKKGHKVTLFASSDSKTKANLVSDNLISLSENKELSKFYKQITELSKNQIYQKLSKRKDVIHNYEYILISKLYQMALAKKFDIVYINLIKLRPLPFAALSSTPTVFTFNDPLTPLTKFFFSEYKKRYPHLHFVGISRSQIKPAPDLFSAVVYNGIEIKNFPFNPKPKNYLFTAGRIAQEKGIYEAIQVAKKLKEKLIIAGRHINDLYWYNEVKPYLNESIQYKGLLPLNRLSKLYQNAKAFIFPLKWEEPFGLIMAEAMSCGTPVIAFKRGSVPEVIKDKVTGFVVEPFEKGKINYRGFIEAIKKIDQIDRRECRKHVEENFTVERMVDNYEGLFYKILEKK